MIENERSAVDYGSFFDFAVFRFEKLIDVDQILAVRFDGPEICYWNYLNHLKN